MLDYSEKAIPIALYIVGVINVSILLMLDYSEKVDDFLEFISYYNDSFNPSYVRLFGKSVIQLLRLLREVKFQSFLCWIIRKKP